MADTIREYAQEKGRLWLDYDECKKTDDAKVLPDKIIASYALLGLLHKKHTTNLSFKQRDVTEAIGLAMDKVEPAWFGVLPQDRDDYVTTMTRRLRNLCRVVANTKKNSKAAWLLGLPWKENEKDSDDSDSEEPVVSKKPAAEVSYGFLAEIGQVYRRYGSDEERTDNISIPSDADDDAPVIATFQDGTDAPIPALSCGQWRQIQTGRQNLQNANTVFTGMHKDTKHKITVALRREDGRHTLMSIFEQSRQICQINIEKFGPLAEPRTEIKAAAFMTDIAKEYCRGTFERENIYTVRDAAVAEAGLQGPWRRTRKASTEGPGTTKSLPSSSAAAPASADAPATVEIKKRPASAKNTKTPGTSEGKKAKTVAKTQKASQPVAAEGVTLEASQPVARTRPVYRGIPGPEFGDNDLDWQIASMNAAFEY